VAIVFSGRFEGDEVHKLALQAMTDVLEARLFDAIRQELGGTYSITVDSRTQQVPRPQYTVRIDWTCDPARADALVRRAFEEIGVVKTTRLSASQTARLRDSLSRELERKSEDNGYLLDQLARRYENGGAADATATMHETDRIAALTADAVQQAARAYLNTNRYVKIVLMPETK